MTYKEHEILARVHKSMSDLYSLTDDGELDESLDILIDNDVNDIVWYEIAECEHLISPYDSKIAPGFDTIEDAKKAIDYFVDLAENEAD